MEEKHELVGQRNLENFEKENCLYKINYDILNAIDELARYTIAGEINDDYCRARLMAFYKEQLDKLNTISNWKFDHQIKCDEETNSPEIISQNKICLNIKVQPKEFMIEIIL